MCSSDLAAPGATPIAMAPGAAPVAGPPRPPIASPAVPNRIGPGPVDDSDPLEGLNRAMFKLNNSLRANVFEPVSDLYHRWAPPPVQTGVHNFFANLREPVTAVSHLLEGRVQGAVGAAARFGINTVIGIAGVFDPATPMGFPAQPRNLEQTLCAYRLPAGPYVVLPILGPATVRDSVGRLATAVAYYQEIGRASCRERV